MKRDNEVVHVQVVTFVPRHSRSPDAGLPEPDINVHVQWTVIGEEM